MDAVALVPEGVAGGCGPPEPLVAGGLEFPAATVGDAVVEPAEQDKIRDVGRALILVEDDVVCVAP